MSNQSPSADAAERSTSEAQKNANRENAKLSTGPTTPAGKESVSQNRRSHGLIGRFDLTSDESLQEYYALIEDVHDEYKPQTPAEYRLTQSLIQHYWLVQRALRFQTLFLVTDDKKLALFLRYQATHERSYYKAKKELKAAIKERQDSTVGFERQKINNDLQEAKARLTNAKAETLEVDTACRQAMEAPMPGTTKIGFEQLAKACSTAIAALVAENERKAAA